MRVSRYRITARSWASAQGYLPDNPLTHWHGGLEYRAYANTERGIRRQVNALIRELSDGYPIREHLTLDASNNPADNLFAPGARAKLDTFELERHRVTWRITNAYSVWGYGRVFVHVERGRWEH